MFDPQIWRVAVEEKGFEREPVVIVDSFAERPQALIEQAARLSFGVTTLYYPGIRAELPGDVSAALMEALGPLCERVFDVSPSLESSCYSLVTTPAAQLAPIQRLPHYDGMEPRRLALILYLCDPRLGGTSFYRHRSTGFETVTRDRFISYRDALAGDVRRHGLPPAAYHVGDTPLFERIAVPAPVFNRALIYRGRNLHSGDITPDFAFDPDPRTGRLTLTGFMI